MTAIPLHKDAIGPLPEWADQCVSVAWLWGVLPPDYRALIVRPMVQPREHNDLDLTVRRLVGCEWVDLPRRIRAELLAVMRQCEAIAIERQINKLAERQGRARA